METHERVRALRAISKLTRIDVAAQLGVSLFVYNKMEKGTAHITVRHLERLADIFDVPVHALFGKATGSSVSINITGDERMVLVDHLIRTTPSLLIEEPSDELYKQMLLKVLDKLR